MTPSELRARFVVVVTLLVFGLGCITIEKTGVSSRKQKRAIVNMEAFKLSKALYPTGEVDGVAVRYPELDRRQMRHIGRPLGRYADALVKWLSENRSQLSGALGQELSAVEKCRVKMTNTGEPAAYMGKDGTINLDVRVAQGLFLGSLVDGLKEHSFFGRTRPTYNSPPTDLDLLTEFLDLRRKVETTKGRTLLGDLLSDDPWIFNELVETVGRANAKYTGTSLFLLSHEIGHLALNHFSPNRDETVREMELTADRFAIHMMVGLFAPVLAQESLLPSPAGVGSVSARDFVGYFDLFQYSFKRAGFVDGDVGHESYPTAEERLTRADEVYTEAIERLGDEAGRALEAAWNRALQEATEKQL